MRTLLSLTCVLLTCAPAAANDPAEFPKDVPPVLGMAKVAEAEANRRGEWSIKLTLPKIAWQVVGEVVPKRAWPELDVEVKEVSRTLTFGGPSQLSPSRVVNLQGQELSREEITQRLAEETPVLVAVSGRMPDEYYLQLTRPDALIVILNARDDAPAPELLPARKAAGN